MRSKVAAMLAAAFVSVTMTANAQSLLVDLQPTGGTTAPGYVAYEATNQDLGSIGTAIYSAFDGTDNIGVTLSLANLPNNDASKFRAVARNGAADDINNDWLGIDTRPDSSADATMLLTISGLPTGTYDWISLHHDGGAGSDNGNIDGLADYSLTDSNGTVTVADGIAFSREDMGQPIFSLNSTIESDGSDVVFSMIKDNGQSDLDDLNAIFTLMGGFQISQVPEPTTLALFGLGLVSLIAARRRK